MALTLLAPGISSAGCLVAQSAARQEFSVDAHRAFVLEPPRSARVEGAMPWVWYAPTLGNRHPNRDEQWMIDRLHAAGIAIAGIDVGESYGNPRGSAVYQALYEELTNNRGYKRQPVLLARSRGSLMPAVRNGSRRNQSRNG